MAPTSTSMVTDTPVGDGAIGCVVPVSIPEQKHIPEDGRTFPHVVSPITTTSMTNAHDATEWATQHRHEVMARLKTEGAIVFRGFPLHSAKDFSDFVEALGSDPFPYVGGAAPRNIVYKDVFTTNESPPESLIPFHHEMAQVPKYPKTLYFFCEVAPKKGGETPIVASDVVYERVKKQFPEFVEKLEQEGVVYKRTIPQMDDPKSPIGRGWVSTFGTSDKHEAERVAADLNVVFEWLENGDLRTISPVLAAIREYDGKKVWFNSVIAAFQGWQDVRNDRKKAVLYGNGDLIDEAHIEGASALMHEASVAVKWMNGDVIMIDNDRVMHSRKSFEPPRRILAYLGKN